MPDNDPPRSHNFEQSLDQAAVILKTSRDELISIKVRPIEEVGRYDTSYLSTGGDYPLINQALQAPFVVGNEPLGFVCDGNASLLSPEGGLKVIYVEHESGPELFMQTIVHFAEAVVAAAVAANQIMLIFNNIGGFVWKAPSKKQGRNRSGRFVSTSIEKRTSKRQKLIRQIDKTARASDKALEKVEELFDINQTE